MAPPNVLLSNFFKNIPSTIHRARGARTHSIRRRAQIGDEKNRVKLQKWQRPWFCRTRNIGHEHEGIVSTNAVSPVIKQSLIRKQQGLQPPSYWHREEIHLPNAVCQLCRETSLNMQRWGDCMIDFSILGNRLMSKVGRGILAKFGRIVSCSSHLTEDGLDISLGQGYPVTD